MSARATAIPADVRDVLALCQTRGAMVYLPEQLPRKQYEAVNTVLVAHGGKWSRREQAHVFPDERAVAALIGSSLAGEYVDAKANGFFETPPGIVSRMVQLADLGPNLRVLEPSAGQGAIAAVLADRVSWGDAGAIDCCEIMPAHIAMLETFGFHVVADDFLTYDPPFRYDRIVMNPPFADTTWARHVLHAWALLAPRGRLVSIAPAGFEFRSDRIVREVRDLIDAHGGWDWLPENAFAISGTNVATCLLHATKPTAPTAGQLTLNLLG